MGEVLARSEAGADTYGSSRLMSGSPYSTEYVNNVIILPNFQTSADRGHPREVTVHEAEPLSIAHLSAGNGPEIIYEYA